jgi:hypothetical protein
MEQITRNYEGKKEDIRGDIDHLIHEIMDAFSHLENPSKDLREAYNRALDLRDVYLEEMVLGKSHIEDADNLRNRNELIEISKEIVAELKKERLLESAA